MSDYWTSSNLVYLGDVAFPLFDCPYILPLNAADNGGNFGLASASVEPFIAQTVGGNRTLLALSPFDYGQIAPYAETNNNYSSVYDGLSAWTAKAAVPGPLQTAIRFYGAALPSFGHSTGFQPLFPPNQYYQIDNIIDPPYLNILQTPLGPSRLRVGGIEQIHTGLYLYEFSNNFLYCFCDNPLWNGLIFDADSPSGGGGGGTGFYLPYANIAVFNDILVNRCGVLFGRNSGGLNPGIYSWDSASNKFFTTVNPPILSGDITNAELIAAINANGPYNSTNFWIAVSNVSHFAGQAQTPLIIAPQNGGYYRVKFIPQTADAITVLAQAAGMQLQYSKFGYFMLINNSGTSKRKVFTSYSINLSLSLPVPTPPIAINLPCFTPCIPNIVMSE